MNPKELLEILSVAEKLKCNTRHCDTSSGRRESVAEHSWRTALMAMLLTEEFPEADMDKVIRMCLIHDMGEAFTGDIPTFEKTGTDTRKEDDILLNWVSTLPEDAREEWTALLTEMNAMEVLEATQRIVEKDHLTTMMITHNMRDAISYGNRLIMMYEGHTVVDVSGEEKKNLTVEQLLNLFSRASGSDEADDKLLLS